MEGKWKMERKRTKVMRITRNNRVKQLRHCSETQQNKNWIKLFHRLQMNFTKRITK